jgi:thioredoxin 1
MHDVDDIPTGRTVLIKFGATWCAPCKQIQPYFEQQLEQNKGHVHGFVADVDENEDLATEFDVSKLPSFVIAVKTEDSLEKIKTFVGGNESVVDEAVQKAIDVRKMTQSLL